MPLTPCPACRRHLRLEEERCPFCAAPLPAARRSAGAVAGLAAALALTGCPAEPGGSAPPPAPSQPDFLPVAEYGAPPLPPSPEPAPVDSTQPDPAPGPQAPAYGAPPGR